MLMWVVIGGGGVGGGTMFNDRQRECFNDFGHGRPNLGPSVARAGLFCAGLPWLGEGEGYGGQNKDNRTDVFGRLLLQESPKQTNFG